MRQRIAWAIVIVAVSAVLFAGIGATLLSQRQARRSAIRQLSDEATALVPFVDRQRVGSTVVLNDQRIVVRVRRFRQALRLVDASVVIVNSSGNVVNGVLPSGVPTEAVGAAVNANGASGMDRRLAWAVALGEPTASGRRVAVVLTRNVPTLSGALPWVALSGVIAVILAVVAAGIVARRIARPFVDVEHATRRIAEGDLSVRIGSLANQGDDEAARLARSIDMMASSLEHASDAQREFLLSVSHDLRTPLTSMRGYADAIVDGVVDDPKEAAKVILTESVRLERLVRDLLDLARMDAQQFSLQAAKLDVLALVRGSVAGFLPSATEHGLAMRFSGDESPIFVMADADRLSQVLANLIENAVKFAKTTVTVEMARTGTGVAIRVVDDGPGIDPHDIELVFDRFYVGHRTPDDALKRSGGSGLGLATSRGLVTAMGGTLSAESSELGGAAMVVVLPIVH